MLKTNVIGIDSESLLRMLSTLFARQKVDILPSYPASENECHLRILLGTKEVVLQVLEQENACDDAEQSSEKPLSTEDVFILVGSSNKALPEGTNIQVFDFLDADRLESVLEAL
jgi:hypothetical protein